MSFELSSRRRPAAAGTGTALFALVAAAALVAGLAAMALPRVARAQTRSVAQDGAAAGRDEGGSAPGSRTAADREAPSDNAGLADPLVGDPRTEASPGRRAVESLRKSLVVPTPEDRWRGLPEFGRELFRGRDQQF